MPEAFVNFEGTLVYICKICVEFTKKVWYTQCNNKRDKTDYEGVGIINIITINRGCAF